MAAGAATPKTRGPLLIGKAKRTSPIKTIVVSCQENHSFDHYFGTALASKLPSGYGTPSSFENSGTKPFHMPDLTDEGQDPNHDWSSSHSAYADGAMSGFVDNGGTSPKTVPMGYYDSTDIPFYYDLLPTSTLCADYHCGLLTETLPNRMVLYAGTTAGITDDTAPNNGTLTWPCITHLMSDAKLTVKNYNFHAPSGYSYLCLWKGNSGTDFNQTTTDFKNDCSKGTLPNLVFIEKQTPWDEHPYADVQQGMNMMKGIYEEIYKGPQWKAGEVVILHTYDEGGGFFDHVPPKQVMGSGVFGMSGIRVPMIVTSPHAKQGAYDTTYSDHGSVLKFIEHVFGLPTLASVNKEFNSSTPSGAGQGGGAPFPPRDGSTKISNLTQCFSIEV
jgi:phospholipase C